MPVKHPTKSDIAAIKTAIDAGSGLSFATSVTFDAAQLKMLLEFMDTYEIVKPSVALAALVMAGLDVVPQLAAHKTVARRMIGAVMRHTLATYKEAILPVFERLKHDLDENDPRALMVLLGEMQGETPP